MNTKEVSKAKNKIKGTKSEILATNYLKKKGYKILQTNYKNKIGEIDIIALFENVIVFVEVKSRETLAYGRPIEAVDRHKQNKLKQIASFYLAMKNLSLCDVRFDVIEILDGEILDHVENAF